MPTSLKDTIEILSERFAAQLMASVRGMSLSEILEASNVVTLPKVGKRNATSKKNGGKAVSVEGIVAILKQHPKGIRAEHLRKQLGAEKSIFSYYTEKAVKEKRVRKAGERRATTYFAT